MDAYPTLKVPEPQVLAKLSTNQLVSIIIEQQKIIESFSQEPTDSSLPADNASALVKFPPNGPHLLLPTEGTACYFPLASGSCWTVGRSEESSIVLGDRWMSRTHAMIQCMAPGDFYLIDLGSRNGTFVNGRRVSVPVSLQNGDRITFGQTELDFYNEPFTGDLSGDNATLNLEETEGSATVLLHIRRLLSVLVVDIRGFTQLTRQLDEQLLSEVIGTWFHRSGDIIRQYGSWVDKYIGDAVMAVWIHESEEISTIELQHVLAALHDLKMMTSQLHLQYPLPGPLRIGAGINTGYAMVGNTGSGDRPDYTALGDTVNAAFRLESSTKQLGLDVAIGATSYHYLVMGTSVPLPFRPQVVNLKGYESPVPAYVGTFEDLRCFLAMSIKRDDTLY